MFKILIASIIAGLAFVGGLFTHNQQNYDNGGEGNLNLGSTNFPTSLDSLTNPNPTDSVATVSHSAQHANANDAIEALEAKTGTGASTAVTNSIFSGNGTGSSIWTTYPTSTNFYITSQGLFGSFISLASSTIVGNLNITGNSTTTNATTTNLFTTTASTTNFFGANLSNCSSNNALTWTNGRFGCESTATAVTNISTTTTYGTYYGTTTITGISANKMLDVAIYVGTTTASNASDNVHAEIVFNDTWIADVQLRKTEDGAAASTVNAPYLTLSSSVNGTFINYITMKIDNLTGHERVGTVQWGSSTWGPISAPRNTSYGNFTWATTSPITSISIREVGGTEPNAQISSTTIYVIQN